jgi:hypothetical protein
VTCSFTCAQKLGRDCGASLEKEEGNPGHNVSKIFLLPHAYDLSIVGCRLQKLMSCTLYYLSHKFEVQSVCKC